jgi:hypothetical protein
MYSVIPAISYVINQDSPPLINYINYFAGFYCLSSSTFKNQSETFGIDPASVDLIQASLTTISAGLMAYPVLKRFLNDKINKSSDNSPSNHLYIINPGNEINIATRISDNNQLIR